ncbi:unnamed protein product [Mortierella alpina]
MTSDECLLLEIVTNNDYNLHFHGNGITTNLELIHELGTRLRAKNTILAKVQTYIREVAGLSDPSTSGHAAGTSRQYVRNFTDAIKVFATMFETPEVWSPSGAWHRL